MTEFVRSLPTKTLTFSGDALEDVPVCTCRHVTSASACYSTCADMSSVQLNVNSLLHPYGDACKCVLRPAFCQRAGRSRLIQS